mmetsp:Transcript_157514/g.482738  ORF Transcript_157514/g.482738 Transcript_157514/m.482738 type:complete len:218 (-) Transcript_157514:156-809(-)
MGCLFSAETVTCPSCQTKNELVKQSFDSDSEAIQKYYTLAHCNKCGCGLATDGCLWSKPGLESFEAEMVIELTDDVLNRFVPSNPYDQPCKGFKFFFKGLNGQTHGLWLTKSDLKTGIRLHVAVSKPDQPESVADKMAGVILTAVLEPEDLIPIPKAVEELFEKMAKGLPGMARLERMAKELEENGGKWGGYEDEVKHEKARVMRWEAPEAQPSASA